MAIAGTRGAPHTALVADIGGTNARLAIADLDTLQQIFDRHGITRCDFLKMNCEGAEYEILYRTPPEYLRRVERIALEYHAVEDKTRLARGLAAFLVAHGIEIFEFTDFVGMDCGYIRGIRRH